MNPIWIYCLNNIEASPENSDGHFGLLDSYNPNNSF